MRNPQPVLPETEYRKSVKKYHVALDITRGCAWAAIVAVLFVDMVVHWSTHTLVTIELLLAAGAIASYGLNALRLRCTKFITVPFALLLLAPLAFSVWLSFFQQWS